MRLRHVGTQQSARVLSLLLGAAVFVGCASAPGIVSQKDIDAIRTVDVVIQTPPSNYNFGNQSTVFVGLPGGGVAAGAALGVGLIATVAVNVAENIATAMAREGSVPIAASVDDIDLRTTAFRQLQALRHSSSGPALTLVEGDIPAPPKPGPQADGRYKEFREVLGDAAKLRVADATLFLSLAPTIRDKDGNAGVYAYYWLVDRQGKVLLERSAVFRGPDSPSLARREVIRWWSEGRYRRMTLQGTRAVLMPLAQNLFEPPAPDAEARIRSRTGNLAHTNANSYSIRSGPCSVDTDDAKVMYRFERLRFGEWIGAMCPGEQVRIFDGHLHENLVPDVSWLSEALPPPTAPTLRSPS
jgi:hypothetical protein